MKEGRKGANPQMHIFIDESGSFVVPPAGSMNFSCIGAAVVPEATANLLWQNIDGVRQRWRAVNGELKGSTLSEHQVAHIINMAAQHGVRFFVAATEMSFYKEADILRHRDSQADRLVASLTPEHHPSLVAQVRDMQSKLHRLPSQLFVQFALMTELVCRIIRTITVYYALNRPRELGAFHWKLDGKDSRRTTSEMLWQLLAGGLIQSQFIHDPFFAVREGNYEDFDAEFLHARQEWPDHLPQEQPIPNVRGRIIDLRKILTDSMKFADSRSSLGLQLVDVLTNAYRRAVTGRLQRDGWSQLPKIMLSGQHSAIGLVRLGPDSATGPAPVEYASVLAYFEAQAMFMLGSYTSTSRS